MSFAKIALLLNKREDAVRKVLSRTLASLRASYVINSNKRGGIL